MNKVTKTKKWTKWVIKTSMVVFLIVSFSSVFALGEEFSEDNKKNEEIYIVDENSSIYKYNAIENTTSYFEMIKGSENLNKEEKNFQSGELMIDDSINKLENIIERNNFSINRINESMDLINKKSRLKTFMVGNNLGVLKFQLVQINDGVNLLNNFYLETEDGKNKIKIEEQIRFLKEEKLKVELFILDRAFRFSLFGWFVEVL